MAFGTPIICHETTTNAATGGGSPAAIVLDGKITGHRPIADLGDGKTAIFIVHDGGDPVNWEEFEGTYVFASDHVTRDTLISSSTGSFISWPGTGTRNIYIHPGEIITPWVDPAWSNGIVVRKGTTAAGTFGLEARQLAKNHTGTVDDFLSWTNATGVSGNPTLNITYDPLARNAAATATQRTMTGQLVQGATSGKFTNLAGDATTFNLTDNSDVTLAQLYKTDADDALFKVLVAGTLQSVLTQADDGIFADVQVATSSEAASHANVATDTTVSITVPTSGTYTILVFSQGHADADGTLPAELTVQIRRQIGGTGGFLVVSSSTQGIASTANAEINVWSFYAQVDATQGEQYEFQTFTSTGDATLDADAGNGQLHFCAAILLRTA